MGFVLFALVMVLFLFVLRPMQRNFGEIGLVGSELSFLVVAIIYALIFRIPLKEMFPVKKFSARDFFGSLFLTAGGVFFGLISIILAALIFPSSLQGSDIQSINKYIDGGSGYIVIILLMAVLPAICEEAIHRGAILTNLRTIKKEWIIVLIMGLFFGINHWSVLRFANTAIMGCCLTYIVVRKNNIILTSIMHFLINFSATTYSYVSNYLSRRSGGVSVSGDEISAVVNPASLRAALSSFLFIGAGAPFLMIAGLCLLNPETNKKIKFILAGIIAAVMITGAAGVAMYNASMNILQTSFNYKVVLEESKSTPVDFEIIESGDYDITCTVLQSDGEYLIHVEKPGGDYFEELIPNGGNIRTYKATKHLERGRYRFIIINGKNSLGDTPVFSIQINKAQET